ncbi:SDR family oxidoreductase [Desulfovibrio inopinatus]|uniref:SDR family oxidoreductase n=1 Tax=Desulfovibrio inopinatus TaxID=102109 RepID=UPI00042647F3|nr:SDR family oxidoreductase [Desulfovibrio inopinatus]
MTTYDTLKKTLQESPRTWLVTGAAGFIGSNLVETLLRLNQTVVGFDNFSNGYRENLVEVQGLVGPEAWSRFTMVEADLLDMDAVRKAVSGVDYVLHQAALGSVPRSINNPIATHHANVTGTLNMLVAIKDAGTVKRFVYAGSSSTYGDHPFLPKIEERIGMPLSPYAATKAFVEVYAKVFSKTYGIKTIGLRYFNVFGRRQQPGNPYAAVIPLWFNGLLTNTPCFINGDGQTSRDFCYIDNTVQANLLAATTEREEAQNTVYNIAYGRRVTLNKLFEAIRQVVIPFNADAATAEPEFRSFRPGDVRHSLADITRAQRLLGYEPQFDVSAGLAEAAAWYVQNAQKEV